MKTLGLAIAVAAMLGCGTASAITVPESTAQDKHLQIVPFTSDVIAVQGKIGMMTVIRFNKGENVVDYGMGDKDAWLVKYSSNEIRFVPKAAQGDTNMFVVTTRHKYWFSVAMAENAFAIESADDDGGGKRKRQKQFLPTTWELQIDYPKAEQQAIAAKDPATIAAKQKSKLESAFERAKREGRLDADYGYIGDDELLPTAAYNNGEMTFILFPNTVAMPTVFEKEPDGTEVRAAFHMEGDMMVIHTVARKLMIRRGGLAGCLVDGQYNPTGSNTNTNTISPAVQRELNHVRETEKQ